MKTKIFIIAAVLLAGAAGFTTMATMDRKGIKAPADDSGHVLTALWSQYEAARKDDKPLRQIEILEKIRKEAQARRYHWDYYDALNKWLGVQTSRNWKLRAQYRDSLAAAIEKYGEPIVTYMWKRQSGGGNLTDFILTNRTRLEAGRNPAFYKGTMVQGQMNGLLADCIKDDFEFALWNEYSSAPERAGVAEILSDKIGNTYPSAQWLEFLETERLLDLRSAPDADRMAAWESYARKYEGKAVSLFARERMAWQEFGAIQAMEYQGAGDCSSRYKALADECKALENERKAYTKGMDSRIARSIEGIKGLLSTLEEESVDVYVDGGRFVVTLRNVDKVTVEMLPEKEKARPLLRQVLPNPRRSFYAADTVTLDIPRCDDGEYSVSAKGQRAEASMRYNRYSLSIAARQSSDGIGVFVADSRTGEPAGEVDLELERSGRKVASADGFVSDGFAVLPSGISGKVKEGADNILVARQKDSDGYLRMSPGVSLPSFRESEGDDSADDSFCQVFTDKGAYNPGETVHFKALFYEGSFSRQLRTTPEGVDVSVSLADPEGNELESVRLKTNGFGSVAGSFEIPVGCRNGLFTIEAQSEETSGGRAIRVDEFVLPTYDVRFDKAERLYFPGDTVRVTGKVGSYSGHSLAAASAVSEVKRYGSIIQQGDVRIGPDGSFSVVFIAADQGNYITTVKVSDSTGETKEFTDYLYVDSGFGIGISVINKAEGSALKEWNGAGYYRSFPVIVSERVAKTNIVVRNSQGQQVRIPSGFVLKDPAGNVCKTGSAMSGDTLDIHLDKPGEYILTVTAVAMSAGGEVKSENSLRLLSIPDDASSIGFEAEHVFKLCGPAAGGKFRTGDTIDLQAGSARGPVWMVVELFGDSRQLLQKRLLRFSGEPGQEGSLQHVVFPVKEEYPGFLFLSVFYFHNGAHYTFTHSFVRERTVEELPLSFSSFRDRTFPGEEYTISLETAPGVEALAAVFDKSSETIARNTWPKLSLQRRGAIPVWYAAADGGVRPYRNRRMMDFKVANASKAVAGSVSGAELRDEDYSIEDAFYSIEDALDFPVMEESSDGLVSYMAMPASGSGNAADVPIRSDYSTTLAFEPFLRSGDSGRLEFKVRNSDKLSTFVVQVWAHDRLMKNNVVRKEMLVSIPVKVSVVEPKYLYKGDAYILHGTVSNNSGEPVSGTATLQAFATGDHRSSSPLFSRSMELTVPAGGSVPVVFEVGARDCDTLGLKLVFADGEGQFSDGMFVKVPVLASEQTLTESHSAVLLDGEDKEALLERLRSEFTGTSSLGAVQKEIDVRAMLLQAVPGKAEPKGKDVLSLSEAFYVRKVAEALGASVDRTLSDADLSSRIASCQNADGGAAWFEGMKSSPVITAVLLERYAKLRGAGLGTWDFDPARAVAYLDRSQFLHGHSMPYWCGCLSAEQYAFVRSLYAEVLFDVSASTPGEKDDYSRNLKEFKKFIKDYLTPGKKEGRGLNGRILEKARRIKTLVNLVNNEGGAVLAREWGIRFSAVSKMNKSAASDVESLLEYSVDHRDGGKYYPNAVMPWRGLLESELYAHALLSDLLSDPRLPLDDAKGRACADVAKGVRLWMMLQKETQQWDDDPAFVDAVASVVAGGEEVLSTKVIALTKTYSKPFGEIAAAGNGFTVERRFFKAVKGEDSSQGRVEIFPGSVLRAGDKVTVEYRIWNQENRSFVKLTAPREAMFRPVDQLSGHYGWWLSPFRVAGTYSVTPQGYRNVKTDCTEYFFDVYPEEDTVVSEDFFITQDGTFSAPVVTVESLYAPHYRANAAFQGPLGTK